MEFLEKDLEEIIWDCQKTEIGRDILLEKGLEISGKMFRQFYLGEYGTADLISIDFNKDGVFITIYELKKDNININTLIQSCRYFSAIKRYNDSVFQYPININIVLIGKEVDKNSDFVFLYEFIDRLDIYEYKITINGLSFEYVTKEWCINNDKKLLKIKNPISILREISLIKKIPY